MAKPKPTFARKILLGIGLDPDRFIKEARNSREAKVLIDGAIRTRDMLYHPDKGFRDNEDFQSWNETRMMADRFTAREIWASLNSERKGKKSHKIRQAVQEVEEEAEEEVKDLMNIFATGTYTRDLEDQVKGNFFVVRRLHQEYGIEGEISPDDVLEIPLFQRVASNEESLRNLERAAEKMEKAKGYFSGIEQKLLSASEDSEELHERKERLQRLKQDLEGTETPEEFYLLIRKYHDELEFEAGEVDPEGIAELYSAYAQHIVAREEGGEWWEREGSEIWETEKMKLSEKYVSKMQELRKRIEGRSVLASELADKLLKKTKKGKGINLKGTKFAKLKQKVKDEQAINALDEMIELSQNFSSEASSKRQRMPKSENKFSRPSQEFVGNLPNTLGRAYLQSRDFLRSIGRSQDYLAIIEEYDEGFEIDEDDFEDRKRKVMKKLGESAGFFENQAEDLRGDFMGTLMGNLKRSKKTFEEIGDLLDDKTTVNIPDSDLMDLFSERGNSLFRVLYREGKGSTRGPVALVYVDENMEIHYVNPHETGYTMPEIEDFDDTQRRMVAFTSSQRINRYLNRDVPLGLIPGAKNLKIRGQVFPRSAVVESEAYKDFGRYSDGHLILSVERDENGEEVYRIEGQVDESATNSLRKLIEEK